MPLTIQEIIEKHTPNTEYDSFYHISDIEEMMSQWGRQRFKEGYNDGVKDALKEVQKFDGIIIDVSERNTVVRSAQEAVSYKPFIPIKLEQE